MKRFNLKLKSTEGVILCAINGDVHQFIGYCLIPLDPWVETAPSFGKIQYNQTLILNYCKYLLLKIAKLPKKGKYIGCVAWKHASCVGLMIHLSFVFFTDNQSYHHFGHQYVTHSQ